jgi:hypothetical protein
MLTAGRTSDTRTYRDIHYQYIVSAERSHYAPYLEFLKDPQNRTRFNDAKDKRLCIF